MAEKEIALFNPITVAGVTLTPVVKVNINYHRGKKGAAFTGSIRPDGIVIVTSSSRRVFCINGEEITGDQMAREFPDLMERINEL